MRFALGVLICLSLLAFAGCGGGTPAPLTEAGTLLKGTVVGGGKPAEVTAVNVYEAGHVGEADRLIATVPGPNKFSVDVINPGLYDVQILFDCGWTGAGGIPKPPSHLQRTLTGISVTAQGTDLGTIDLGLPVD